MPRPKREGGPEPKKRSRHGCWPCKARKVKCGEEKPQCLNCQRQGEVCDYSIRLNWDGRTKKTGESSTLQSAFSDTPSTGSRQPGSGQYQIPSESPSSEGLRGDATSTYSREGSVPAQGTDPVFPRLSEYGESSLRPTDPMMSAMPPLQTWSESAASGHGEHQQLPGFAMLSQIQQASSDPFLPSPEPFGSLTSGAAAENESLRMPPPYAMSPPPPAFPSQVEAAVSPVNTAKRVKLSGLEGSSRISPTQLIRRSSSFGPGDLEELQRPGSQPLTPTLSAVNYPPSGSVPSFVSDETRTRWASRPMAPPFPAEREFRRVSVNSLLSGSPDPEDKPSSAGTSDRPRSSLKSGSEAEEQGQLRRGGRSSDTYGFDRGQPDLDIPRNNDAIAISAVTPSEPGSDVDSWLQGFDAIPEFAFGLQKHETVFAKGGYYAHTVPIRIPRFLEPLPNVLTSNPMNLLYFHHFLNHTARILVPHDCSENPFKTVLPKIAVENSNVLNLLLAYSASHRARLLQHPEPAKRIAHWVQDVFPSLRHALDNVSIANAQISDANLATAIMLSSLEIISPSTFGISIPWQTHLGVAREIINARYSTPQSISRDDPVAFFLSRWFAYLDVLGSFSGRSNPLPLFSADFWTRSTPTGGSSESDEDYLIDCLLGMTPRCLLLLAQIASLARQCDNERISSTTGFADPKWKPSPSVRSRAESLRDEVEDARTHLNRPCPHHHNLTEYSPARSPSGLDTIAAAAESSSSNPLSASISIIDTATKEWDNLELLATNDSFHLAALIHLHRRILFLPRGHPIVQSLVHAIVSNLYKVRKGGSAEACLLFPMFTAGCEALEDGVRGVILERIQGMEEVGMMQVTAARRLMERVWRESTGQRSISPTPFEEQEPSPALGEDQEKRSGSAGHIEKGEDVASEVGEEKFRDPMTPPEAAPPEAEEQDKEADERAEEEEEDSPAAIEDKGKGKETDATPDSPLRERGWEEFLGGGEFLG